jgi:hypothetical protein
MTQVPRRAISIVFACNQGHEHQTEFEGELCNRLEFCETTMRRLVHALQLAGRIDERGFYNTTGQVLIFHDQKQEIGEAIKAAMNYLEH